MAIQKIRVSLNFSTLPDGDLSPFAGKVIVGISNPPFDKAPVLPADMQALRTAFDEALKASIKAGSVATATKNAARASLIDGLTKDALWVQIMSNNDLATLLTSGYEAASTNRAQDVLAQVQLKAVENAQSGELKVRVQPVRNAKSFEGRIKAATGSEFGPSITFASSRKIIFKGLTAGVSYVLQVCAIGGSTGRGDWSDPSSHMAM